MPLKLRRYAALEKRITKKIILFGGDFAGEDIFKLSNEKFAEDIIDHLVKAGGEDAEIAESVLVTFIKKSLIVSWQINAKTKVFTLIRFWKRLKNFCLLKRRDFMSIIKKKKAMQRCLLSRAAL